MGDENQGIVHVIGPEQGLTQPGMTIVCGDSHTSTHGAFGALAFGIGTSEVEHVLATQTLPQRRPKTMAVDGRGDAARRCRPPRTSCSRSSAASAPAAASATSSSTAARPSAALSMEGRMTVCNMTIEGGARGPASSRRTTRPSPTSRAATARPEWRRPGTGAVEQWRALATDAGAASTRSSSIDAAAIAPHVTWGTNPGQVVPIDGTVPDPAAFADPATARPPSGRLRTWA